MQKLNAIAIGRTSIQRVLRPHPRRKQHTAQGGLREARRDVDDQVADRAVGACL